MRHHYTTNGLKSSLELLDVGRFGCRANKTTFDDIYIYICHMSGASRMLESGVLLTFFLVSKSEDKSCTKPTDALRESKVIGPLHILSSWHQQFLQLSWRSAPNTACNKLFTFVQLA